MTATLSAPSCPGDDPCEANAVFNQVMQATTTLTTTLDTIARRHGGAAPASAEHVRNLLAALSGEVLVWIWQWPS